MMTIEERVEALEKTVEMQNKIIMDLRQRVRELNSRTIGSVRFG